MLTISELFIYPIKSLAGIAVNSATITARGLAYDRRWMLVDSENKFLTQRQFPTMALLQVSLIENGLWVQHKKNGTPGCFIPHALPQSATEVIVQVWDDVCKAKLAAVQINDWFSAQLGMSCQLVYMDDDSERMVDKQYAIAKDITSFSDGYPILIIGQQSLLDLNSKLETPLPVNRFRPNIVFTGGQPFEEDGFEEFSIHKIVFFGVKLCARCMITTINQDDAGKSKEPLKTLATYRLKNNKIYFGQNLLHQGQGIISIGNELHVRKKKSGLFG